MYLGFWSDCFQKANDAFVLVLQLFLMLFAGFVGPVRSGVDDDQDQHADEGPDGDEKQRQVYGFQSVYNGYDGLGHGLLLFVFDV